MPLTLNDIAKNPNLLRYEIFDFEKTILRPLEPTNFQALGKFLADLSPATQKFYKLDTFDIKTAKQMCEDINKYDKLRFVVEMDNEIVALFEFSMDIPEGDFERFDSYGIQLNQGSDCRFGPCISDRLQGQGFGTITFPYIEKIAKQLGQKRIILWGGVFEENAKAINYYKKNGFKEVGRFKNKDEVKCIDMIKNL